ncbi:hypothetical protein G6O67_001716 [Ophiocordyceps sinensis]|uniref:DUF7598 domain-containing protein n=1 Tax=Ophiocordyceps sinensis TaxID=72228 RepID=A0A8H4V993_9HYPO|nr:hypothetical protein G6O67_001716 [Ophiocordyceps sinensis]
MVVIDLGSFLGVGMVLMQLLRLLTVVTLGSLAASYGILVWRVDKRGVYFAFKCAWYTLFDPLHRPYLHGVPNS